MLVDSVFLSSRSTYFFSEDKAILEFLLTNDAVGDTGGNTVWKQMESYKVFSTSFILKMHNLNNYSNILAETFMLDILFW